MDGGLHEGGAQRKASPKSPMRSSRLRYRRLRLSRSSRPPGRASRFLTLRCAGALRTLVAPAIVDVTVGVVPATAIAMVIIVWPTKWTPRCGHHSARCAADYSSDRAADHSSANGAGRSACSLNWGGAGGQGEARQRYGRKLVHSAILERKFVDEGSGGYRAGLVGAKMRSQVTSSSRPPSAPVRTIGGIGSGTIAGCGGRLPAPSCLTAEIPDGGLSLSDAVDVAQGR